MPKENKKEQITFEIYKLPIPSKRDKRTKFVEKGEFLIQLKKEKIDKAKGCYIFALQNGKNITPWYVGKATKTFGQEVMSIDKRYKYEICFNKHKGTSYLFLITLKTKTDRYAKGQQHGRIITWLEDILIYQAFLRNRELINDKKTSFIRKVIIPGFLSSGNKGNSKSVAKDLKKMLMAKKPKEFKK